MPVHGVEHEDPYKVHQINTLKKAEDTKARAILEQIAKQVQPILRKRQWRVPLLSEFFPRSGNLLGLNIGGGGGSTSEIKIRLRRHNNETDFYSYEHTLGTMLHEITHNVQGAHNAVFYKILDELTAECEELMAKGISGSGQGFDARSQGRLGGRGPVPTHNPPPHRAKDIMLKAAEERARKQAVMPAGPRRLGGDLTSKGLTPAQAAAMAAERRAKDNVWCPSGQHGPSNVGYNDASAEIIVLDHENGAGEPSTTDQGHAGSAGMEEGPPAGTIGRAVTNGHSNSMDLASSSMAVRRYGGASGLRSALAASVHRRGAADRGAPINLNAAARAAQAEKLLHSDPAQQLQQGAPPPQMPAGLEHDHPKRRKAAATKVSNVIDLTVLDDNDAAGIGASAGGTQTARPSAACSKASGSKLLLQQAQGAEDGGAWTCRHCTLVNTALSLQCTACAAVRPAQMQPPAGLPNNLPSSSWPHPQLGAAQRISVGPPRSSLLTRTALWQCNACTLQNAKTLDHCEVCGSWRYSTGLPTMSRPTLGGL